MSDFDQRFGGIERLYGTPAARLFRKSRVAIVGLGGVGSWTAEALARSGVGHITLMDLDDVCITNVNRQIHAHDGTFGKLKIDALEGRLKLINPEIVIHKISRFFSEATQEELFSMKPDCVVDAIDSGLHKAQLVAACRDRKVPVVVCGGAGGKIDPTQISVCDLAHTRDDALLAQLRRTLRNRFGFPSAGSKKKAKKFYISAVSSPEALRYIQEDGTISSEKPENSGPEKLSCAGGLGSVTHVTGCFGFIAAGEALRLLRGQGEA